MPAYTGYFDTLQSVAGKVFTYLASITLTGTDGKTITCTQDTTLDGGTLSDKAPKTDVIKGDGTAGRAMRAITLVLNVGTNPSTIKPSSANIFNGDVNAAEDNLGKSGDTGVFALNAAGDELTLQTAGITGDPVAVLACEIGYNISGSAIFGTAYISGTDIAMALRDATTGTAKDLTVLIAAGNVYIKLLYVTSL